MVRENERKQGKKKPTLEYRLPNELALLHLTGSACLPFDAFTPQPQPVSLSIANKQTQCSLHAVFHHSGSLTVVRLHAALQTDPGSAAS